MPQRVSKAIVPATAAIAVFVMGAGADVLEDIRLLREGDALVFSNSRIGVRLDAATGRWDALLLHEPNARLASPADRCVDFCIDGRWMMAAHEPRLVNLRTAVGRDHLSASVHITWEVAGEYELTAVYTLYPGQSRLRRSAVLARKSGDGPVRRFMGFRFSLPGVKVDEPENCGVYVPGPFVPKSYVRPGTPPAALADRQISFHSAPDAGFGILAVAGRARNVCVASWMDTGGEVAYRSFLSAEKERVSFRHDDMRACRLAPGMIVESDAHHIEIARGGLREALAAYRDMVARTMPPRTPPQWARTAIILEAYPQYFPGGFRGLAERLPFYRDVGFNTLYLMPHWRGGYSPLDPFAVEPSLGTPDDLRHLVRRAHDLGMKVLFDMVIHGFNEKSPVIQQHPAIFARDEAGLPARHPTWKSVTTDWAAPAYRKYMVDLALHDLREYDIDGYRVDAATFKGPAWDPALPYPAYRSGSAAPELISAMLSAMRRHKPDAIMLSEVFGPLYYASCDLVHDNQTEAPQFLLEQMEKGLVDAADYKAHMAAVHDALPAGAARVMFARNHDTSWFYRFNGYTPRFMAMDAIHALMAIPEVFAGDHKHGPHPDDDPATWDYYRKIFAARKRLAALSEGEVLLHEVQCDNRRVFTGIRRHGAQGVLVAVSLSDRAERAQIAIDAAIVADGPPEIMFDPITGRSVAPDRGRGIVLDMAPFQVFVGEFAAVRR